MQRLQSEEKAADAAQQPLEKVRASSAATLPSPSHASPHSEVTKRVNEAHELYCYFRRFLCRRFIAAMSAVVGCLALRFLPPTAAAGVGTEVGAATLPCPSWRGAAPGCD